MLVAADGTPGPDPLDATPRSAIAGRLFVVGCERSGTTLLQSLLAAHPAALSFPETFVFGCLLRSYRIVPAGDGATAGAPGQAHLPARRRTQMALRYAGAFLDALGRRDLERILPPASETIGQFADRFVGVLDRLALDLGKSWWVEKTPENIRFVSGILELVPGAKVINILRDGRQNVAALYGMARQYPHPAWDKYRDLDVAIRRWNSRVRHTRRLLDVPAVMLVRYERLVAETEAVMEDVCRFAGLPFSRDMIERRAEAARKVLKAGEPWKADVLGPIRAGTDDKFNEVFSAEQKAYIEARLERIEF